MSQPTVAGRGFALNLIPNWNVQTINYSRPSRLEMEAEY